MKISNFLRQLKIVPFNQYLKRLPYFELNKISRMIVFYFESNFQVVFNKGDGFLFRKKNVLKSHLV